MPALARAAHPAVMHPASAQPIRLPVKPAAQTARVSGGRMMLKLDRLVATPHRQRLVFNGLASLEILVPSVNHHLAGFSVGHDFGFRLAII